MPKYEPKDIQHELEKGRIWPVYWLFGKERMKARELLKRIRRAVHGEEKTANASAGFLGFNEENLDGTDTDAAAIVDAAQSLSLGGGTRLVLIREAHAIKDPEPIAALFGQPASREELLSVCVFLSKDLDGRKKFSKQLVEKAAVVSCEEVADEDREPWIGYLAKRRGVTLTPDLVLQLRSLEPWSLDIVDQELDKFALSGSDPAVLLGGSGSGMGADLFVEAFFGRDFAKAMSYVEELAESPEESLPLLGLLAWNVRYLALLLNDQKQGTRHVKLSPFLADRLKRWARLWTLDEMLALQKALAELDFSVKQTARAPLGLWSTLVMSHAKR